MPTPRSAVRSPQYPGPKPDTIDFGGYRLAMRSHGSVGWKVFIYPPDSVVALETMPHNQAPDSRETVIAEAKQVVKRHRTGRR